MRPEFADGGNFSGSGSGSVWDFFFCVDRSPFRGFKRRPRMVTYFLFKYFSIRSDDKPVQEVNIFFVISFTHLY